MPTGIPLPSKEQPPCNRASARKSPRKPFLTRVGLIGLIAALSGCDDPESEFISQCERQAPDLNCACVVEVARSKLSADHFDVFIKIGIARDPAAMKEVRAHMTDAERQDYEDRIAALLGEAGQCFK